MSETTPKECKVCKKTDSDTIKLQRCNACKPLFDIWYCGKECQKADWKQHKRECLSQGFSSTTVNMVPGPSDRASNTPATNLSYGKGLEKKVSKPFHSLKEKKWLHDRPENDTYKLLIDTFRLMLEDDYKFEGNAALGSIYDGEPTSLPAFRAFLNKIEKKRQLLPTWWSKEKRRACESIGCDNNEGNWADLSCSIEKHDVVEQYGDSLMPMQLRMFREQITGRGPMGQSSEMMMKVQLVAESNAKS